MKKLLLIPTTLTVLTPLISVVGCGKPETPIVWEVTKQEMEDAISMKGVEYLQYFLSGIQNVKYEAQITLSPTKVYSYMESNNDVHEIYSEKNESGATDWTRYNTEVDSWSVDNKLTFETPQNSIGPELFSLYQTPTEEFKPNPDKKCYTSTYDKDGARCTLSFYFKDKKLIKCEQNLLGMSAVRTFGYDKINPEDPTIIDLNDAGSTSGVYYKSSQKLKLWSLEYFKFSTNFQKWSGGSDILRLEFVDRNDGFAPVSVKFHLVELYVDDELIPPAKDLTWEFIENFGGKGYVKFYSPLIEHIIENKSKVTGIVETDTDVSNDWCFCFDNYQEPI